MNETIAEENGICCRLCQEDVNVHGCKGCGEHFNDGDVIFCINHSQTDCEHYHKECSLKSERGKNGN